MKIGTVIADTLNITVAIPTGIAAGSLACAVGSVEGCARSVMCVAMSVFQRICGQKPNADASWTAAGRHLSASGTYAVGVIPVVSFAQLEKLKQKQSFALGYWLPLCVLLPAQLLLDMLGGVCNMLGAKEDPSAKSGSKPAPFDPADHPAPAEV